MIKNLHSHGLRGGTTVKTLAFILAVTTLLATATLPASAAVVTLANYDFNGTTYVSSDADVNSTAGAVTAVGTFAANFGIATPPANNTPGNTTPALYVTGLGQPAALSTADYFSFKVDAASGYVLNLQNGVLTLGAAFDSPGRSSSFFVRSSQDGYTSDLIGPTAESKTWTTSSTATFGANFNNLSSIEFRIYTWGDVREGDRAYFDNFSLTGVSAVPEPTHYALAGFALVFAGVGAGRRFLAARRKS